MPDLTITRVFDAPRNLVFKAWTDTAPGNDWSAPRRFTVALFEADLRPGGAWRLCMRTPDGEEPWVDRLRSTWRVSIPRVLVRRIGRARVEPVESGRPSPAPNRHPKET
jgi:uncharacterized protein YndB with AHSA1/START domain